MNWLLLWTIYIVIFLGVHYWIHRGHRKRMEQIYKAHDAAMEKIMAAHRARVKKIFARYRR